jgi:CDP-paratose 2-epimerase
MTIVLVTGSAGLIGSESVRFFCVRGFTDVDIDNNMRSFFFFFGKNASTELILNGRIGLSVLYQISLRHPF